MQLGARFRPLPAGHLKFDALAGALFPATYAVPASADWFVKAPANYDALGNLITGNCVPCAMYNQIWIWRANAWGDTWVPTGSDTDALYRRLTGYDGTPATDLGTDTASAMEYWENKGIWLDSQTLDIVHPVIVRPVDINRCIHLFGGIQVTLALPIAAQDLSNWGKTPDLSNPDWRPGSWGIHRAMAGAFSPDGRTLRTWGRDVEVHPDYWQHFVIGHEGALSRTWLAAIGSAPNQQTWAQLLSQAVG